VESLLAVPENVSARDAVLLPFVETAVSFLMDGAPLIGEKVVVLGQGIIGLLVTALLSDYPLSALIAVDRYPLRRDWSHRLGAHIVLNPAETAYQQQLQATLNAPTYPGADLVYELTGNPRALDQAIACAGFDGRVVVGSWYGSKTVELELGSHFHRNQIKLVSSQVSHIAPRWRGRFDKRRRMDVTWDMLSRLEPQRLITHVLPVADAAQAYRILDKAPETAVQVVLDYGVI
jgi:threonine dehydrogenase-like Zn-dependent dehydrogenase